LYSPPTIPPEADFSADIRIPTTSDSVTFTDLSTNIPTSWSWSISPATITYKNGTSSSSQNPCIQFTAEGYYQVTLLATNAYGSDSIIKTKYIHAQDYCSAEGLGDIYISSVTLGTIDNTGTGEDGYTNYDNLSTQLTTGSSNTITISLGHAYSNDTVAGWIDWNQDGDFDDTDEEVFWIDIHHYTVSSTITVPHDAKLGFTRMRIRNKHSGAHYSPCGTTSLGEVEDYAIEVTAGSDVWKGTTTQWNAATNWSVGVIPTASYNVTIPTSPSGGNFPTVPAGYTAKCNKFKVESGASVTVNGNLEVEQE
jgi:PKD repeat protein